MNIAVISGIVLFVIILFAAVIKSRRANPEESTTQMHPDNFKKPVIEKAEYTGRNNAG